MDDQSIRRHVTFDIDSDALKGSLKLWDVAALPSHAIPLVMWMRRDPILDLDLVDERGRTRLTARRRENAAVAAYCILGYILNELHQRGVNSFAIKPHLWAPFLLKRLLKLTYETAELANADLEQYQRELSQCMPSEIPDVIRSPDFNEILKQFNTSYIMCVVDPDIDDALALLKFSYVTRFRPEDETTYTGIAAEPSRKTVSRSILSPFGPNVVVAFPNLGDGSGSYHARVEAPSGMAIDGIHLSSNNKEIVSFSTADGLIGHTSRTVTQDSGNVIQVMHDRRHALFLNRGPGTSARNDNASGRNYYQLKIDFNPLRGRFLLPSTLLTTALVLICVTKFAGGQVPSDFIGMILAALVGLLVISEEHAMLSSHILGARILVGCSVLAGVILGVFDSQWWVAKLCILLPLIAFLLSVSVFLSIHTVRIQAIRLPSPSALYRRMRSICIETLGQDRWILAYATSPRIWLEAMRSSEVRDLMRASSIELWRSMWFAGTSVRHDRFELREHD